MKYKRMALAACALLLLLSATNLSAVLTDEHPRYHQHLERPAYTPCAEHDGETLCTHLPLVLIDTGGEAIPGVPIPDADSNIENDRFTTTADGSTLLRASVSVVDHAEGNNHPADTPTLQSVIDIRVRGNSSRYFDKHSYLVKTLTDDGAASRDVAMLGMDAFDEWALHGPYLDKTLIRNYMWYNLAGEIMDYAPNVRFCEVLLNGVYQGLYVMTETVSSGADARLKLTEPSKDTVQTSYALRLDRGSGNEVKNIETFSQYALRNLQDMDIVYPGTKWLTPERAAWIAQDFSDFEKSLYSYDYDTEPYAWWEQADMSSFVDYFILNEFTCNYDAGWLSTYIYRDVRGKYKMCIWDFNSACDNYSHPVTEPQHFELQYNVWYYMLSKDEKFINAVIDRYRELRQGILSDEYLCVYMDDVTAWLGDAVERNDGLLQARGLLVVLERAARQADVAAAFGNGLDAGAGAGRVIGEGRARVCLHEGFAQRADDFFHRGGTVGRDCAAGGRAVVIRLLAAAREQRERHDDGTQNGNDLFQDEVLLSNFNFDSGFLFPTLHRIRRGCKNEKSAYVKCV